VYVVDDEPAIRDSLAMLLRSVGLATRTFDGAQAFLDAFQPAPNACLLADVRMPGMSGLELQSELARRGVGLPVIIVTAHGDVAAARSALRAGAIDFIEKPIDDEALAAAIADALDRDARSRSRAQADASAAERLARLTGREREVLELVTAGRHNREIAVDLGISPRTVEVYKARLMEKLQVRRVPELVRMVLESRPANGREP
jgi:RNA polymerase sigma factor (sigma-70 family)